MIGGTTAAAPPPFRPGNPALCGSCPLATPYYCRLGDLMCSFCIYPFCVHYCVSICVFSCFRCLLCFFVDLPSVLWYCWLGLLNCKNRLPYNLYCVGGDVKHCTIDWLDTSRPAQMKPRPELDDTKTKKVGWISRPRWSQDHNMPAF